MFPADNAKFLRIALLYNTFGGSFWQSYHGFWSKTFTKRATNNYLLSCDKTISFLFKLIGHMLLILEDIYWKTYLKYCRSNYVISLCNMPNITLQFVRCSHFQGIIWKLEKCCVSKNIALKIWQWKSWFWFCSAFLYFADLKPVCFASCLCYSSKFF